MDLQAVVIGGGQAGLATSYELKARQIEHVVLERGQIGESWREQRWDSFHLNTPGWANGLPGAEFPVHDGFGTAADLVRFFQAYRDRFSLPVWTETEVRKIRYEGAVYTVETEKHRFTTPAIVLASGLQNHPRIPEIATRLPRTILQLHAADYRNPGALPDGRVLLVGAAQTGCQIAEELLEAGREVFMATGRVPRVPRRYRGRDIFEWLQLTGFFAQRPSELPDPGMLSMAQPQVSGTAGGHTISYQDLAARGVRLLGRLVGVDGTRATFAADLREHVAFADQVRDQILSSIDGYIERQLLSAPAAGADPADSPAHLTDFSDQPCSLDLVDNHVTSVIWCTGFGGDFAWLPPGATRDGKLLHDEGIGVLPGSYFVGLPWMSRRDSGILLGVPADAARIAETLKRSLMGASG